MIMLSSKKQKMHGDKFIGRWTRVCMFSLAVTMTSVFMFTTDGWSPCYTLIGDYVWDDLNRNGIQNSGEPGIENVRVLLKSINGAVLRSAATDPTGHYAFTENCPGTYIVEVDESTLPDYYVASSPCSTDSVSIVPGNDVDSNCNPQSHNLGDNGKNHTIDFGYYYYPPSCGNRNLDNGEQCDDGNNVDGDGCNANCMVEYCGDGIQQSGLGEACDDGNTVDSDGCSANCTVEPLCGNGELDPGEQCDDGNNIDGDGCSATCMKEPDCGDGDLDPGEQCDDGNNIDGDGCSAKCTLEGGGQGCTPGYWKQGQHFDSWMGYAPNDKFSVVFGSDVFDDMTLLQVLWQGGGGIKALGRHAVAALLNADSTFVSSDRTAEQVIRMFNAAYVSGDKGTIEMTKNVLNYFNEQGCPLN